MAVVKVFSQENEQNLDKNQGKSTDKSEGKKDLREISKQEINDLADTIKVKRWNINKYNYQAIRNDIDSSLEGIQHFAPLRDKSISTYNLGLIGQAINTNILSLQERNISFLQNYNYEPYIAKDEDISYFQSQFPYNQIEYYGPFFSNNPLYKILKVKHSQNVNKNWSFGGSGQSLNFSGKYPSQNTRNLQICLFTSFKSKYYENHTNLLFTMHEVFENGGIKSDTVRNDPKNQPFNIISMSKIIRNYGYNIHHKLNYKVERLLKSWTEIDTIKEEKNFKLDTILKTNTKSYDIALYHNISWMKTHISMFDNDFNINIKNSNSPDSILVIGKEFRDFTQRTVFSNSLSLSIKDILKGLNIIAGFEQKNETYIKEKNIAKGFIIDTLNPSKSTIKRDSIKGYYSISDTYNSFSFVASMDWKIYNYINIESFLKYQLTGYQQNYFLFKGNMNLAFKPIFSSVDLFINHENRALSFFERNSPTNAYKWADKFESEKNSTIGMAYNFYYRINIIKMDYRGAYSITNHDYFYYFNKKSLPSQSSFKISEISSKIHISFWDIINLKNECYFQKTTDEIVSLPELTTYSSLYFRTKVFKVFDIEPGCDLYYFSKYYTPAYNPYISQFIEQRNEKYGDYPIIDVFINFKLATVKFFVKYENFQLLFKSVSDNTDYKAEYMSAYRYPNENLPHDYNAYRLRFGIIWKLFN